jgi:uncharacterized BrkB/YihY/UPF0761 family membrane protein
MNPMIRWLGLVRSSVARAPATYLESGASQFAGMLAFSLFVALVPLSVGVLTVFGFLADTRGQNQGSTVAQNLLVSLFPTVAQHSIRQALVDSTQHAGTVAMLSVVGLVWFSTGAFSTIGFALNRIYGMADRSVLAQRARGLWVPVGFFALAYAGVGINLVIQWWSLPGWLAPVTIWVALASFLSLVYQFAPSHRMAWSAVLPGAGLAAAAIVGLAYVFPLYAELTGYLGTGVRFFATVFGLVAWVYLIAQAVLSSAVLTRGLIDAEATRLPGTPSS